MTPERALIEVLNRVGAAHGAAVRFSAHELKGWPAAAVAAITKAGLLTKASPAASTVCPGCERECAMPAHNVPSVTGEPDAFIVCDKRSDTNRVPVAINRLEQWQTTGTAIARLLAGLLDLHGSAPDGASSGRWEVGRFKGMKHAGHIVLLADDRLRLTLAGHEAALADLLTLTGEGFAVDKRALRGFVDHPVAGGGDAESAAQRRARISTRREFLMAQGDRAWLKSIAREEGVSKSRVQQILRGGSESKKTQFAMPTRKGPLSRRP
jgi:hypothetical protein